MKEKRGSWHLLSGAIIGLLAGLVISLLIMPVRYTDTEPYSLRIEDRETYRSLIASAFLVEADTPRALTRLALLKDVNPVNSLVEQAQVILSAKGDETQARALALLAAAQNQPAMQITPLPRHSTQGVVLVTAEPGLTATSTLEMPTKTPRPTLTPRPTFAPTATLGAPFALLERKELCNPKLQPGTLQVYIKDANSEGVIGVRIEISSPGGASETFYTGFFPDIDPGYADYQMVTGFSYNLRVGETGEQVMNLAIPDCVKDDGEHYPGVVRLNFQQP